MQQFITASDTALAELEDRARRACVLFRDQQMPPGATPTRARVGFEVDHTSGDVALLVDRGIRYPEGPESVRSWFAGGELRFPSFVQLRQWLRQELAPCYARSPARSNGSRGATLAAIPRPGSPATLTDLGAVRDQLPDHSGALYVDEEMLADELGQHVLGQDAALRTLSRRTARHLARRHPRRPVSFFLVGPTGVGKTRTAESLPIALRAVDPAGEGYDYLRLDMAEYQERYRVSQLLGSPQGYVGHGDGSQLIDALVHNPRTAVLFDEIEKAHPDVLRALMNAMDAGRLSSAANTAVGRQIDCREAIFLFTSNLDAGEILSDLEERNAFDDPVAVDELCRSHLRSAGIAPELIGRIASFLVFQPLSSEVRAEIVTLAIERVAQEYGVRVGRVEPSVILAVIERQRGTRFGARPDEYVVDDLLGAAFMQSASARLSEPVEVCGGPPFFCVPLKEVQTPGERIA